MAKAAVQQDEDKVLEIIEKTLDDNKAEDVVVIDLRGKTSIANQMVVASGTSQRHVASLAEKVQENLKAADWVLIDAFDVIVHIFKPEVRAFYSLEKMWSSLKIRSEDN